MQKKDMTLSLVTIFNADYINKLQHQQTLKHNLKAT